MGALAVLLPMLIQAVPSIATLIAGGKTPAVLDAAGKVAREVFGTDDPDEVKAKLDDPAQAEVFKARLEAETAQMQAQLADVANAREMQVSLANAPEHGFVAFMPSFQTLVNWTLAAGVIVGVGMGWLREDGIIVGFGIGAYTASNNFWLGSSSGSKRSADAVRSIAERATLPSVGQIAGRAIDAVTKRR